MPLRIPTNSQTGYKVSLREYVCGLCDNEFWAPVSEGEVMICPYIRNNKVCGGISRANGDVSVIVKAGKKEKIIDINE